MPLYPFGIQNASLTCSFPSCIILAHAFRIAENDFDQQLHSHKLSPAGRDDLGQADSQRASKVLASPISSMKKDKSKDQDSKKMLPIRQS